MFYARGGCMCIVMRLGDGTDEINDPVGIVPFGSSRS